MSASSPEPMSPGSPANMPNTSFGANSPYLPGFLLGDQTPTSSMQLNTLWKEKSSPGNNKNYLSKLGSSHEPSQRRVTFSPLPPSSVRIIDSRSNADKHGGPPIHGLFDQTASPAPSHVNLSQQLNESIFTTSFNQGIPNSNASLMPSSHQPSLIDESQLDGSSMNLNDDTRTWVTIYGFPPNAASFLLQQFSQYGTICKHKMSDKGNWMHICYQSKLQAKRAISKNGKVIGGSMMVGVKLCDDKSVIDEADKENSNASNLSILRDSGMDQTRSNNSLNRSGSMRPLTQAYRVAANDREVSSTVTIPQKSNSVIAKAMDYVFGW